MDLITDFHSCMPNRSTYKRHSWLQSRPDNAPQSGAFRCGALLSFLYPALLFWETYTRTHQGRISQLLYSGLWVKGNFLIFVFFFGLISLNATAEVTEVSARHFRFFEHYSTKAAAYESCTNLMNSLLRSTTDINYACRAFSGPEAPTSFAHTLAGWYYDNRALPSWDGNSWYLDIWACAGNESVKWFPEDRICATLAKIPQAPNDPRGAGDVCTQPHCGNPINIGGMNKVQHETDFQDYGAGDLSVKRTYNGGAYSTSMVYRGSFGSRWMHDGDRH